MRKIIAAVFALGLIATAASFADVGAKDGVYFAQEAGFGKTGWKSQVIIEVVSGKIVKASWNGISNLPGIADKKGYAAAGKYGMAKAATQGDWDKQAAACEAWLVKTQNVGLSGFAKDGKTDAISGATMSVSEFFTLAKKALAASPVPAGMYRKDGWFYAEQPAFDPKTGWKDSALVTVVNGTVVDVLWNGTYKDSSKKSKLVEAVEGRYGMAKAAKKGEWDVQSKAVSEAIVKAQDPKRIKVNANGIADAISGATIRPIVLSLADEALKAAR